MKPFLAALRFLTVLPVPGTWGTGEEALAASVPCFPLIGLLLGAIAAAVALALVHLHAPAMVAGALLLVLLLGFSGGLHLDGLSDTADGFFSSRPRERILEIMKDSHVGAMGVMAVVCLLLVQFAALSSVAPGRLAATVLLMPLGGRCGIVIQMALLRYARPGGLATVFCRSRHRLAAAWAVAVLAGVGWLVLGYRGLTAAGACVALAAVFSAHCYRKIGGCTGDTFGATCELAETVPALVMAMWPG